MGSWPVAVRIAACDLVRPLPRADRTGTAIDHQPGLRFILAADGAS